LLIIFLVFTVIGTFAFNYGVSLLKLADLRFGDKELFGWLLAVTSVGSLIGSRWALSRFLGTTPIGAPITGWVADHIGAEWSLADGSVISLACVAIGVVARRRSISADVPTSDHIVTTLVGDDPYGGGIVLQDGSGLGLKSD
jgi:MFS family permease